MYTRTFDPSPDVAIQQPLRVVPATCLHATAVSALSGLARTAATIGPAAPGTAALGLDRIRRFAKAARRRAGRMRRDENGASLVEFGFLAPVFIGLICAIMEFSGIMFVQTLLEGSAGEASRYGITGYAPTGVSREQMILAIIEDHTYGIIDMDKLDIETLVYENFGDIGQPEPFEDQNGNGAWDSGEPFTDINGNGKWDPDMGAVGLGGPGAVVVYRLTYDWPIMIPMFRPFFGETITLRANVAVRNEPWTPPPAAA